MVKVMGLSPLLLHDLNVQQEGAVGNGAGTYTICGVLDLGWATGAVWLWALRGSGLGIPILVFL